MPDSTAGTWASLDGAEITNSQRTIAYIQNFNLALTIDAECWCPSMQELLMDPNCETATGAGPNGEYTFPSEDPAPWYDVAYPESGDFLGFLTLDFEGLGSTYTRSSFDVLQGGAVLGKLRPQARVMTWRGWLFGRTCCAAEYGLRWLTAQLAGGVCDDCRDKELDILICCPSATGDAPQPACGNEQEQISCETKTPIGIPPDYAQMAKENAFRTFHRVGLADGPRKLSQRSIGCGSCEEGGQGCMIEAEFSLIAGNPFQHREPICVCGPTKFPVCEGCNEDGSNADLTFWQKINTGSYPASEDDTESCTSKLECTASPSDCNVDPNCPTAKLPKIPAVQDDCGCESIFVTETCCHIKADDTYGQFFEGIPQIKVFSGERPMQNVTIRIYENPQERDCADKDLFDICNLCDSLTIRYIPAMSTLTIDSLTKRINIECPGGNIQPAESLMTSNFRWPVFKCIDYIVKISADCCLRSAVSFVKRSSNGVNINTFTGNGTLFLENTTQFPGTGGTITVELDSGAKVKLTYTGVSGSGLTGVNSNGQSGVLGTGDKVTGPDVDPDCTLGVAPDAQTTIIVIPREM